MIIRREDFGDISTLSKGSHKNIWFTCDYCGIGVLQSYRNYLAQNNGKYCRTCRNKHTANREDVKEKQSKASKKNWESKEYREKISPKLSKGCKEAWDKDNGTRRKLISENSKKNWLDENYRKRVIEGEAISIDTIKERLTAIGYEFLERKLGERGGAIIKFKCDKGHIEWKRLDSFGHGRKCYQCYCSSSGAEREISSYIKTLEENVILNDRKLIKPFELDIVIPNKKLAIEYCGLFWHGEKYGKGRQYHLSKLKKVNEQGYRLLTIFEDEWIFKQDIVKNRLKYILGLEQEKIFARKCSVKEISTEEARKFINLYHIQGYVGSNIKLGLFYENNLVSVMTFSKPSISKGSKQENGIYEISRFCSSVNIVGGASKLFEFFKRNYSWQKIFTFADRRWSEGNLYEKIGMSFIKDTLPNYWYYHSSEKYKRLHRFNFRRFKLEGEGTEWEIMQRNGYDRIWDCGHKKYGIKKP